MLRYNGETVLFIYRNCIALPLCRAGDANLMFEGVYEMAADVDVGTYCRCHFLPILGPQCRCDSNIVEMCDMVVGM